MIYNNLKFKVTTDKNIKKSVLDGIKRNKELFNKQYCPCVISKTDNDVCHCEKFRKYGDCCCKLFVIDVDLINNNFEGVLSYDKESDTYNGYIINMDELHTFSGKTIEESVCNFIELTNNM